MDYAKDKRVLPDILKRPWDLVIVDEAHNAARPHGETGKRSEMERWEAVRKISEQCRHLLLLTATPHNGYTDNYCSLLQMLDPALVRTENGAPTPERERAIPHVCQRTRDAVRKSFEAAGRKAPFAEREVAGTSEVPVELHRDYLYLLEQLDEALEVIRTHAKDTRREQPFEWFRLHLHRRALSSPQALRCSLDNRLARLRESALRESARIEDEGRGESDGAEAQLLASLADHGAGDVETEDERDKRADSALLDMDLHLQ